MLIGNKYKIESTSLQYTIFEKTSREELLIQKLVEQATTDSDSDQAERIDSEGWRPIAYVGTLKSALKFLIDHDIKGLGFNDVQMIVARIAELHILIDAADIGMPKPAGRVEIKGKQSGGFTPRTEETKLEPAVFVMPVQELDQPKATFPDKAIVPQRDIEFIDEETEVKDMAKVLQDAYEQAPRVQGVDITRPTLEIP